MQDVQCAQRQIITLRDENIKIKLFKLQIIINKMKIEMIAGLFLIVMSVSLAGAVCDLSATLVNQDPYPATPGEYVKVVFQINGTENPECKQIYFDLEQAYPFSLDANASKLLIQGGNFISGYPSYWLAAFKVRVDKNALDGDNKIKAKFGDINVQNINALEKDFYINVEETRTDFDVIVQDYTPSTKTLTFAIVNIGKKNAEALTLEIPEQGNVKLVGNNKVVIGSLDINDDTTTTIVAEPRGAGEFLVRLSYNDENSVRRIVEKNVSISDSLLRKQEATTTARSGYFYLFWIVVIVLIVYYAYGYYQRRKQKNNKAFLLMKSRLK